MLVRETPSLVQRGIEEVPFRHPLRLVVDIAHSSAVVRMARPSPPGAYSLHIASDSNSLACQQLASTHRRKSRIAIAVRSRSRGGNSAYTRSRMFTLNAGVEPSNGSPRRSKRENQTASVASIDVNLPSDRYRQSRVPGLGGLSISARVGNGRGSLPVISCITAIPPRTPPAPSLPRPARGLRWHAHRCRPTYRGRRRGSRRSRCRG